MKSLRMANAVVYFRILRSLGRFAPTEDEKIFSFHPCLCGSYQAENIPNGLPDPVRRLKVKNIVETYTNELGLLCRGHFAENLEPDKRLDTR